MGVTMDAGRLRDPVAVLELKQEGGNWAWTKIRRAWAEVTPDTKRNLFSSVGIGANGCGIIVRRQPLTLHQALLWRGRHIFLTAIQEEGRGHLSLSGALVDVVPCRATPNHMPPGPIFPAVLTEKYLRHSQDVPMAQNSICYVLITPKVIVLRPGDLVEVGGVAYPIQVAHVLDPFKNEYEIMRVVDL